MSQFSNSIDQIAETYQLGNDCENNSELEHKQMKSFIISCYVKRLIGNEIIFVGDCLNDLVFNNYLKYLNHNHNQNHSYVVFSSELLEISKIEMNATSYSNENDLNIDMKTLIIPSQVGYSWMFYVGDVSKKSILYISRFFLIEK